MAYAFTDWEGTCLAHHGIKGQKWGVRRYQNPDGTLTAAGKKHEQKEFYKEVKRATKLARKANKVDFKGIANVSYDERNPSARVEKQALNGYKTYNKTKDSIKELHDLGTKWEKVGEKANDLNNYVYNKYRDRQAPKRIRERQERLNRKDKEAMNAYTSKAKSIANDLLGKYGKKKVVVDRVFGIGFKRKTSDIVESALYKRIAKLTQLEREKERTNRSKG